MASSATETSAAATEWLSQLKALKDSLAELKLSQFNNGGFTYGKDIVVDHDNSTEPSSGDDDIWDYLSEDEEDSQSSDGHQDFDGSAYDNTHNIYNLHWLSQRCEHLATKQSGLSAVEMQEQLSALLSSDLHSEHIVRL